MLKLSIFTDSNFQFKPGNDRCIAFFLLLMLKLSWFFGSSILLSCFNFPVLAQNTVHLCQHQNEVLLLKAQCISHVETNFDNHFYPQSAYGLLTEAKWKAIALRYYQSRLRTTFKPHNNILSLWDVQELIGFPGLKIKESSVGNRQYWVWIDLKNPVRKIKATFNYYQLVDLKGSNFDASLQEFIQTNL